MLRKPVSVLLGLALLVPAGAFAAPAHHDGQPHARRTSLPPKTEWRAKVKKKLTGATAVLDSAARGAGDRSSLVLVLDIDNTAIQTHYAWPKPTKPVRRVARHAVSLGMKVFFVTGRSQRDVGAVEPVLRAAGYDFEHVYGRRSGESLTQSKQRNRAAIAAAGYTIVEDIGNRATDLSGDNTGATFKLPSYYGLLS